jgi:hypothetical protein
MSTLLWFILITACMFFMHRGRGSMGGCGGGQSHGSHNRNAPDAGGNIRPGLNLETIPEADYEEVKEEPEKEIHQPNDAVK